MIMPRPVESRPLRGSGGSDGALIIATISSRRRPVWRSRRQRRRERLERSLAVHDAPAHDGQYRRDTLDRLFVDREVIIGQDGEVAELAGHEAAFPAGLVGKPGAAFGP